MSRASEKPERLALIERRFRAMQKVINHDLPNQLVAIHGLLQLLSQDESARLSADGQEILRRLQGTSARVLETAHLLKLLGKAGDSHERPAIIALADLSEETAAEAKQAIPSLVVDTLFPPGLEQVSAAPRALHQAVVLLLKLAAQLNGAPLTRLIVGAAEAPAGRELTIGFSKRDGQAGNATNWSARALEDRLETLLARELIWAAGGELRISEDASRERLFAIMLARPPALDPQ